MAAAPLTADRQTRFKAGGSARSGIGDVAAAAVIYFGATIAKNAAGYIVPASDTAGLKVIGIAQQFVDNTAGADGAATVLYTTGVVAELVNNAGAIVQAGKHTRCYAADDNSVTSKAASLEKIVVGEVMKFTATTVFVFIDEAINPEQNVAVNGAVSPAVVSSAPVEIIPLDLGADLGAGHTFAYLNADKIEIVDVHVIKDGNGAGNTVKLTDSTAADITNAMAFAVDKTITRATTIDKTKRVINAGAGFNVVLAYAAGVTTGQVFVHVIKR